MRVLDRRADRIYFAAAAGLSAGLVLWGFARSYYLRALFVKPPLGLFLHIHAAIMTAWMFLFLAQVGLIALRLPRWHRLLGRTGPFVALAVCVLGTTATLQAAAREVRGHTAFMPLQLEILALELAQMAMFVGFTAAGLWLRAQTQRHKRLMLLGTICMLPNPLLRALPMVQGITPIMLIFDATLAAFALSDRGGRRWPEPVSALGAMGIAVTLHIASMVGWSNAWQTFAGAIVSG